MKTCTKCGEEKPFTDFSPNGKLVSGKTQYRASCKPCNAAIKKARREENKEEFLAYKRAYYHANKNNPDFMRKKANHEKVTYQRNKSKYVAKDAKRHAAKMERTPSWANNQLIDAYYKEAKRLEELTGIKFHVDHIIPLQGELVSGLHVETNLQLLPAHENIGKSNRFDPQTFCA